MNRLVQDRIKSDRGASLAFALLAFLVCGVISAILITALTASTGRTSVMAAMDRRYYSVQSAADMFRKELDGQSYTVDLIRTTTKTVTNKYKTTGELPELTSTRTDENVTYSSATADGLEDCFLGQMTLSLLFDDADTDLANADVWGTAAFPSLKNPLTSELQVVPDVEGADDTVDAALAVDVKAELAADGVMLLTFSSGSGANDTYSLQMRLKASVTDSRSTEKNMGVPSVENDEYETVSTEQTVYTTKETRTARVTWAVENIEVIG